MKYGLLAAGLGVVMTAALAIAADMTMPDTNTDAVMGGTMEMPMADKPMSGMPMTDESMKDMPMKGGGMSEMPMGGGMMDHPMDGTGMMTSEGATGGTAEAIFAGGCFWCMEEAFDQVPGVISTTSGFTGGHVASPSYDQVSFGGTGHAESVKVVYDPAKVSYGDLLYVYWRNVDPTVKDQQFCDVGSQYRSAIFYENDAQRMAAEASLAALEKSKRFPGAIYTQVVPAGPFYAAEEKHQDFHIKNPLRYKYYKFGCGRPNRLRHLWGDEAGGHDMAGHDGGSHG